MEEQELTPEQLEQQRVAQVALAQALIGEWKQVFYVLGSLRDRAQEAQTHVGLVLADANVFVANPGSLAVEFEELQERLKELPGFLVRVRRAEREFDDEAEAVLAPDSKPPSPPSRETIPGPRHHN